MDKPDIITPKDEISFWDIIKSIDPVHISCYQKLHYIQGKYAWSTLDARLLVFLNTCSLAENLTLTLQTIIFTKHNGLHTKEWWHTWGGYQDVDKAFRDIPDFDGYVNSQIRQMIHRVQEQLFYTAQMYMEAFIRNTARQLGIEQNQFWKLKRDFLVKKLGFTDQELLPLTIAQNLRNTFHNKGIHYNQSESELRFVLNGYEFAFDHTEPVKLSWDHYRELLLASSDLLLKIVEHPIVVALPEYSDKNIVVIRDDGEEEA